MFADPLSNGSTNLNEIKTLLSKLDGQIEDTAGDAFERKMQVLQARFQYEKLYQEQEERAQKHRSKGWLTRFVGSLPIALPLCLSIVAACAGWWQFSSTQKFNEKTRQQTVTAEANARVEAARLEADATKFRTAIEAQKGFFAVQDKTFQDTLKATTTLCQEVERYEGKHPKCKDIRQDPKYTKLAADFNRCYYTYMPTVEDGEICKKMALFRQGLDYLESNTPENHSGVIQALKDEWHPFNSTDPDKLPNDIDYDDTDLLYKLQYVLAATLRRKIDERANPDTYLNSKFAPAKDTAPEKTPKTPNP